MARQDIFFWFPGNFHTEICYIVFLLRRLAWESSNWVSPNYRDPVNLSLTHALSRNSYPFPSAPTRVLVEGGNSCFLRQTRGTPPFHWVLPVEVLCIVDLEDYFDCSFLKVNAGKKGRDDFGVGRDEREATNLYHSFAIKGQPPSSILAQWWKGLYQ